MAGRGPKGYQRSDDRIKEEVCELLTQHHEIDATDIEVEVRNGEVTLRGSVDDRQIKRMAEDLVEHCTGVRDVQNQLRVSSLDSNRRPEQSASDLTNVGGNRGSDDKTTGSSNVAQAGSASAGTTGTASTSTSDNGAKQNK
jgi:hypothetical protein